MATIIINADDYGLDEKTSLAIADLFHDNLINRTTMIVNNSSAKEYINLALSGGFLDKVGLHVNLYEGKPLTNDICDCPRFVSNGSFNHFFRTNFFGRFFITKKEKKAISIEINAQFKKLIEMTDNKCLHHFDSHHHIHTDLSIWRIIKKIATSYHFTSTRLSQNVFSKNKKFNPLKKIYKYFFNKSINHSFVSSDYFSSIKEFKNASSKLKDNILSSNKTLELMCHPRYATETLINDKEEILSLQELIKKEPFNENTNY